MEKKTVCFVAGGTAGHINSAIAMGYFYEEKGFKAVYVSGDRHLDFKLLEGKEGPHFKAKPLSGRSPIEIITSIFHNLKVFVLSLFYLRNLRPKFVLGAGGYICGPVIAAAYFLRIPTFIVEQNGVLGLTNKLLLPMVKKVFLHFSTTMDGISEKNKKKSIVVGNPIRDIKNGQMANLPIKADVNIVIFGGSLGAKSINDLVKKVLHLNFGKKVTIVHQVGNGNKFSVEGVNKDINYVQLEYLEDIYSFYKFADLIICRSGASTISELRIFKKPVILIPYPNHKDRQQYYNAEFLKKEASFEVRILDEKEKFQDNGLAIIKEMVDYLPSKGSDIDFSSIMVTKETIFREIENVIHQEKH